MLINSDAAHRRALALCLELDRPTYECEYLALAIEHRCECITADQKFRNAAGGAWKKLTLL
jgi:predicted nucleic acid-binding protein